MSQRVYLITRNQINPLCMVTTLGIGVANLAIRCSDYNSRTNAIARERGLKKNFEGAGNGKGDYTSDTRAVHRDAH